MLDGNERVIGAAVKGKRQDVFITTKLWTDDMEYDTALIAGEEAAKNLGGYIDLLLIHYPTPGKRLEAWRALEHMVSSSLSCVCCCIAVIAAETRQSESNRGA